MWLHRFCEEVVDSRPLYATWLFKFGLLDALTLIAKVAWAHRVNQHHERNDPRHYLS